MNTTAIFSLIDGKLTNMDTQKSISLQKQEINLLLVSCCLLKS